MFHIKDNIYLAEKSFLLNEKNNSHLIKNDIKRILICTEYIDVEIMKNDSLCKFLAASRISIDWVFDTHKLIYETRFKVKGTEDFDRIRKSLRWQSVKNTPIFRDLAKFEGNILLVCNRMNKMSPVFCLLIENIKSDRSINYILDALPDGSKKITKIDAILRCYNMLKSASYNTILET